ncbi:hypothetical protein DRN79_00325 [Methanosarcinales archaeon]|nr:MAG: hypothetical protein DRN79_00325 [Methanosarcinales archaeon]
MIIVLMLSISFSENMRESPNQTYKSLLKIEHAHLYDADPIFLCGGLLTILTPQARHDPSAFPTYEKNGGDAEMAMRNVLIACFAFVMLYVCVSIITSNNL